MAMYTKIIRHLKKPKESSFVFGPRGTGKSTWIEQHFKDSIIYDLLNTEEVLRLSKQPSLIQKELAHLPAGSWVVIDEVQKVPSLLDEVHRLIERNKLRFILSGSSARKLKREGANLLAGRALLAPLFPLVSSEVDFDFKNMQILEYGMLPKAYLNINPKPYLRTYVQTYLKEEIQQEALIRNIGGFARFLEIAARQNAQVTNISNIARDAQVERSTVQGYFEVLIDTLIGFWLTAWKLKPATKQKVHPKFYFFDPGICRALSGRLSYPALDEEKGHLFESLVLHELRSYLSYGGLEYPLFYWSSHNDVEVDFFLETQKGFLAIEVKSNRRWEGSFQKGLYRIRDELGKDKVTCIGVYLGERRADFNSVLVLPFREFCQKLWSGELII